MMCKPLPRSQGDTEISTPESELEKILTWGYFHKQEQALECRDLVLNGLDWIAVARPCVRTYFDPEKAQS